MMTIPPFRLSTLETLCEIIGDTTDGLTRTELHKMLLQAQMENVSYGDTFLAKRKKLYNDQR